MLSAIFSEPFICQLQTILTLSFVSHKNIPPINSMHMLSSCFQTVYQTSYKKMTFISGAITVYLYTEVANMLIYDEDAKSILYS